MRCDSMWYDAVYRDFRCALRSFRYPACWLRKIPMRQLDDENVLGMHPEKPARGKCHSPKRETPQLIPVTKAGLSFHN